jgi:very-short-patch-repair endonuclease
MRTRSRSQLAHVSGSFRPSAEVLAGRAREMRFAPTSSEALLWQMLRGGQLGVGFRRQLVVARFIVDFAAPSVRLAVEVDGACHQGREKQDAARDRVLAAAGWSVLRVRADWVVADVAGVAAAIGWAVAGLRG